MGNIKATEAGAESTCENPQVRDLTNEELDQVSGGTINPGLVYEVAGSKWVGYIDEVEAR